ncbi:MAG: DUF1345 domain-containing protein [Halomonas sp.]|uniref:DUF1345 domain-containing protein n=1 Tax=Halomonas sp. TaxID=1486246 RepID=UPI003F907D58
MDRDNTDWTPAKGERRLGPSLVVMVLVALPILLPAHTFPWLGLVGGTLAIVLLIAVIASDPGRIDQRSGAARWLSVTLTFLLVAMATGEAILLVLELVDAAPNLHNAVTLLVAGTLVWIDVNLTFGMLYWELDCGGPARRAYHGRQKPALAFPEDLNPELAIPGWHPTIIDYLYLGFTNATAFSPTDVMPMRRWVKVLMTLQAMISLALLSLVIANAVNILN